jgi:hypothetical protein
MFSIANHDEGANQIFCHYVRRSFKERTLTEAISRIHLITPEVSTPLRAAPGLLSTTIARAALTLAAFRSALGPHVLGPAIFATTFFATSLLFCTRFDFVR